MKKLLCIVAALCLCAAVASAEAERFTLRFDEGFALSLPKGWVSYPAGEGPIRYALCQSTSLLELNGREFAAFISPALNASGCATFRDGQLITFLFTPQDDSDFMLEAAQIMASIRF